MFSGQETSRVETGDTMIIKIGHTPDPRHLAAVAPGHTPDLHSPAGPTDRSLPFQILHHADLATEALPAHHAGQDTGNHLALLCLIGDTLDPRPRDIIAVPAHPPREAPVQGLQERIQEGAGALLRATAGMKIP